MAVSFQDYSDSDIGSSSMNYSTDSYSSFYSPIAYSWDQRVLTAANPPPPAANPPPPAANPPPPVAKPPPPVAEKRRQRPKDKSWEAMRRVENKKGSKLGIEDFSVLRRVGEGDMGNVFLCCLREIEEHYSDQDCGCGARDINGGSVSSCCYLYAMKVMDREVVERKGKEKRAEVEKKVLRMVDHPFLPTLYAEFEASHFSFLVMDFCSGGDLNVLRHMHAGRKLAVSSARFYAAEVLLALEYLHMLGVIYRDLKPENVLIRSDGHIMLSDFDLSLIGESKPSIRSLPQASSTSLPCFPLRCISGSKRHQFKGEIFTAEPAGTRSHSFVGTHEYVSPEVAAGKEHGSAVDWWAFGIFTYELIYGFTPFAGASKRETLKNILQMPLAFPDVPDVYSVTGHLADCTTARSFISSLLVKDPSRRLGSTSGAAELKVHPFFKGIDFAKIRSSRPPEVPGLRQQTKKMKKKGNTNMARVDHF